MSNRVVLSPFDELSRGSFFSTPLPYPFSLSTEMNEISEGFTRSLYFRKMEVGNYKVENLFLKISANKKTQAHKPMVLLLNNPS